MNFDETCLKYLDLLGEALPTASAVNAPRRLVPGDKFNPRFIYIVDPQDHNAFGSFSRILEAYKTQLKTSNPNDPTVRALDSLLIGARNNRGVLDFVGASRVAGGGITPEQLWNIVASGTLGQKFIIVSNNNKIGNTDQAQALGTSVGQGIRKGINTVDQGQREVLQALDQSQNTIRS